VPYCNASCPAPRPLLTFVPEPRRSDKRGGSGHMQGGRVVRVVHLIPGRRGARASRGPRRWCDASIASFTGFFAVEPYLWVARAAASLRVISRTTSNRPPEFDVVVLILWSRARHAFCRSARGVREIPRPRRGRRAGHRHRMGIRARPVAGRGGPALRPCLVFRNQAPAPVSTSDLTLQALQLEQLESP